MSAVSSQSDLELVKIIVDAGADINAKNNVCFIYKNIIFMRKITKSQNRKTIFCLDIFSFFSFFLKKGENGLHWARIRQNEELENFFLTHPNFEMEVFVIFFHFFV